MPSLRSTLLPLVACLIGSRHAALSAPVTTRAEQLEAEWKLVQAHSMPILCIGADLSRSVWTGRVTDVSFMGANLREAKFLEVRKRCSVIKHES